MRWPSVTIRNFSELADTVKVFTHKDWPGGHFMFRGQSAEWNNLKPAILRTIPKQLRTDELLTIEREIVDRFMAEAPSLLPSQSLPPLDDVDDSRTKYFERWLLLMQHYGAPTRILDWTRSPFAAAYFSIYSHLFDRKDGIIWWFDFDELASWMHDKFPNGRTSAEFAGAGKWDAARGSKGELVSWDPDTMTNRMRAQQTNFTISTAIKSDHRVLIELALGELNKANNTAFGRIKIPASCKLTFMNELRSASITAGTLFPGLDGLGGALREIVAIY